jgi:hypothetical protein
MKLQIQYLWKLVGFNNFIFLAAFAININRDGIAIADIKKVILWVKELKRYIFTFSL